jgi:formylglycine-generating enzyme required for sulfatase activity
MKSIIWTAVTIFVVPFTALPEPSSIRFDSAGVTISWPAVSSKQYNVLTTTVLGDIPWQILNSAPVVASNNLIKFPHQPDLSTRFFQVRKIDTEPPEVWRLVPTSGAIAVPTQSSLSMYLQDETGIDLDSIVLTVGTNSPVTLTDSRLSFANGILTYTPGSNQFLGRNGETVNNQLIFADILGHRSTNLWPFTLEVTSILAENAVLFGTSENASGDAAAHVRSDLALVSSQGPTYVFSYSGATSGLTNGQVLIGTDVNAPHKRKIVSLTDDTIRHTVTMETEQASIAECIQQGSVRLVGDFSEHEPASGLSAMALISIPLSGTVIYDNGTIRVEVLSGEVSFDPDFTVAGEWQSERLVSFDTEISGSFGLDVILKTSVKAAGEFAAKTALIPPHTRYVEGFILVLGVRIPVLIKAVIDFSIGYEAHLEGVGSAAWGFTSSRKLTLGARLRDGHWSHYETESSSFREVTPTWQISAAANQRVYVEPKLKLSFEVGPQFLNFDVGGVAVDLRPYLELAGITCVQPGQTGIDLSLYAGLTSTLSLNIPWWDKEWVALPSWQLLNLRTIPPFWHDILTVPFGSPAKTLSNMVWIPCGRFTMGSPPSEKLRQPDESQQEITISRGFWMGKYEVTQMEYQEVMGTNPSFFISGEYNGKSFGPDLSRPVDQVSWLNAKEYCSRMTESEKESGRLPAGYVYRLPTEAEWEYACRAGSTTAFYNGNALRGGMANFYDYFEYDASLGEIVIDPPVKSLDRTTTVGTYQPNAWGLYDMHGNVWEWCENLMLRGGSFANNGRNCRSAVKGGYGLPSTVYFANGFRIVLAPQ